MSILTSQQYDIGAICDSGDVSIEVTYQPLAELESTTRVILTVEPSTTDDGMVIGSYTTAIIQKSDISAPEKGDTFYYAATDTTYKVLEA